MEKGIVNIAMVIFIKKSSWQRAQLLVKQTHFCPRDAGRTIKKVDLDEVVLGTFR